MLSSKIYSLFSALFVYFSPSVIWQMYFIRSQRIPSSGRLLAFQTFYPGLSIRARGDRCRYSCILSPQSCKAWDRNFHPTEVMAHPFNCQWPFIFPNNSRKRSDWEKKQRKESDLARKQFVSGHCRGGVNVREERPGAGGGVSEHKTGTPQQYLIFSPFCYKCIREKTSLFTG